MALTPHDARLAINLLVDEVTQLRDEQNKLSVTVKEIFTGPRGGLFYVCPKSGKRVPLKRYQRDKIVQTGTIPGAINMIPFPNASSSAPPPPFFQR